MGLLDRLTMRGRGAGEQDVAARMAEAYDAARLLSTSGMMSSSEARTGVHRFRALDGWQVADGVTGFGRTTLALSGAMSATSNWSLRLGLREPATLCWDVTCLPSGCVDLNVSS